VLNLTSSPDGAFYVAGQTDGSFDGQVSNGAMDGFITKYNQDGNKVWTRLIGSNNYDTANALTIGLDGAIYVGGYTTGGSLDGIQNPTNSAGFVSKFLPDGTRVWTKLNSLSQIYELNTGQDGAIFAAGDVWNQYVDGQLNLGNTDIIVLRYETDGKNTWTKLFGSTLNDTPYALSVGIDGSLYLAGITLSDIYGEKSFDIPFYSDGQAYSKNDAFLMKLSVPDNVPPKISISLAGASITGPLKSGESVVLNFAITEAVKDFIATDITVQGGTLSNFQGSDKSYSATFILGFDISTQSVSVGNGKFSDSSGNFNLDGVDANNKVSFNVSVPADTIAPTVAVTANATSLSASKTATITFTLSESSSNFVVGDISVSGGTLSNFAGSGTTYSATFTPAPNSTANGVVSVASGVFTDSGGNANADGADTNNAISLVVDTALPTIALSTSKSSLIAGESTTLIFVLSEPSTTFSVSDVTVSGGKLSNFTGSGAAYAATFIPSDNSTANGVISVSSGVFTDASNNANADGSEANNTLTLAVDTATPTIALSTVKTNLIEGDAATVTFTLSETSSTFTASDITMTGGTLSNFSGSGTTYTATFTPTANSSANGVVSVASGVFTDTAGNINADGADKNNALNFTRVPTVANETHILSVIVDKDVLGTSAALLKDLKESITFTNGVITKHTVEYSSLTFDYAQIDALITTVTRDGEFTAEFTKEINDYVASELNITYAAAVKLVGATSIDAVILSVAGADGNYVG
jgi:hypothetical protein